MPPSTGFVQSVVVPHRPLISVAHGAVSLLPRQNLEEHVVQTVPPEHSAHPAKAEGGEHAPETKHCVAALDASHNVQSPLPSHLLLASHPVDAWQMPSFCPEQ